MPSARINGQDLYFRDSGGDGPAIVFSHGLLMDHEMFGPQLHVFRHGYRCITWDQRGHGRSAGGRIEPFTYRDSADDLAALLSHLGIERAVLAGMSQGGFVSLRCALRHPQAVRGLILLDSQAGLEDPAKLPGYRQMVEAWATQGFSDSIADTLEQIILGSGWPEAGHWKAKWRTWEPHNLLACFQTLVGRDDITERLGEIPMPALVVHGEADVAIPMERAEIMRERLPNARLEKIPGAGHAANLTHPDPVNAAIAGFLKLLP